MDKNLEEKKKAYVPADGAAAAAPAAVVPAAAGHSLAARGAAADAECPHKNCYACRDPANREKVLLDTVNRALSAGLPVIMPTYSDSDLPYTFTIGMPALFPGYGELVIVSIPSERTPPILMRIFSRIKDGTLSPKEWVEGTVLAPAATGLAVSIKIHLLSPAEMNEHLGSALRPFLPIKQPAWAFQLIWADEHDRFTSSNDGLQHLA